ncbi:hypothetical protein [Arthrobacter sp. D1-17]
MATSLVSFNALRPVLFAGTLAVAWLAFSAPSGAADTGAESGPVLGTISAAAPVNSTAAGAAGNVSSSLGTSVAAVTRAAALAAPAPRPPAPTVAYPAPVPSAPQSVPADPAWPASVPVIPLPVTDGLDPSKTVATVIEPARPVIDVASPVVDEAAVPNAALQPVTNLVTESAGPLAPGTPNPVTKVVSPVVEVVSPVVDVVSPVVGVVSPVVDVVSPVVDVVSPVVDVVSPVVDVVSPVVDDVAAPDDVLQPVPALVRDVAPVLVSGFVPATVQDDTVMVLSGVSAADAGAAVGSTGLWSAGPLDALTPCGLLTGPLSTLLVPAAAGSGFQAWAGAAGGSSGALPEPIRAAVSGSGSGQGPSGSQTPAAWLSNNFAYLSVPGSVPVSGPIQHVPAPVSFDPGSSPD